MNKKAIIDIRVIVLLALVALILLGIFKPASIIMTNTDNTFYQYSGAIPQYKYSVTPTGDLASGSCRADNSLVEAGIVSDRNMKYFSSSPQIITVGNNVYEFLSTDVRQGLSDHSECAAILYNIEVKKNGNIIDSISFERKSECGQYQSLISRDYGEVKATFGFMSGMEGDSTFCGTQTYLIHRYEIVRNITTANSNASVGANPSNNNLVVPNGNTGFFNSILNFFNNLWRYIFG